MLRKLPANWSGLGRIIFRSLSDIVYNGIGLRWMWPKRNWKSTDLKRLKHMKKRKSDMKMSENGCNSLFYNTMPSYPESAVLPLYDSPKTKYYSWLKRLKVYHKPSKSVKKSLQIARYKKTNLQAMPSVNTLIILTYCWKGTQVAIKAGTRSNGALQGGQLAVTTNGSVSLLHGAIISS
ncbi:MAG: hypothetical protein ACLPX5_16045 [Dissulfurispiraceae bacterium]